VEGGEEVANGPGQGPRGEGGSGATASSCTRRASVGTATRAMAGSI
jgi:hypothetical protein